MYSWGDISLRSENFLLVILLAIFWYGAIPVVGAFIERNKWRSFRRRFGELRRKPHLDYANLVANEGGEYRFHGVLESVSANGILWIRSDGLTVQADIRKARTYVFPNTGGEENPAVYDPGLEAPEKISWDRISGLTGEVKVFVGGLLIKKEGRHIFASGPETPLMVIFYEGSEKALSVRTVRAGRHRNEYFNFLTPYAFILGAFSQILIAITYLSRPVYRSTLISALIAFFTPILPWIPPGILFTIIYRRLWFEARICRVYRDLARLPLAYFSASNTAAGIIATGKFAADSGTINPKAEPKVQLPNGETFVIRSFENLPSTSNEKPLSFFIPANQKHRGDKWYVFGTLPNEGTFPTEPADSFAVPGILPGDPELLAKRYTRKAYFLEIVSWLFLLSGIIANVLFIAFILAQFGIRLTV